MRGTFVISCAPGRACLMPSQADMIGVLTILSSTFPVMSTSSMCRTRESAISRLPTMFRTPRQERINRWMFHDLVEPPLETVSHPALQGTEEHIVPRGLKCIGSYNWIDAPTPTIIVPGQSIVFPFPADLGHNSVQGVLRYGWKNLHP